MSNSKQPPSTTKLTLSQVARGVGTSPQNLQKTYVKKGVLSVERDRFGKPFVDVSEVIRVFGDRFRLPVDGQTVTPVESQLVTKVETVDASFVELKNQLEQARRELEAARERELWLRGQVDKLTDTVRLLEGPKVRKVGLIARLFG